MIQPPHRSFALLRQDLTAGQEFEGWMREVSNTVNNRLIIGSLWIIETLEDFVTSGATFTGDEIHIPDGVCVQITSDLDLEGRRIVFDGVGVLKGTNAESSSLYSNISSGAMVSAASTLNLRDISLETSPSAYCVDVDGTSNPLTAIDWFAVNFTGGKAAKLTSINNLNIILMGLLFPDGGIELYGTFGTVAIIESIYQISGTGNTSLKFDTSAVITRRIRLSMSAFVTLSGAVGLDVPTSVTIPDDAYIIHFCNFSGDGTPKSGFLNTDVKSRHVENRGIPNTYRSAACGFDNNATATTIGAAGVFVKIAGTTVADSFNSGFTHSNNRLTKATPVQNLHKIKFTLDFSGTTGNEIAAAAYLNGTTRIGHIVKSTANAAGRAENVSGFASVFMEEGDYIEIWAANMTAPNNVTAIDLSFEVAE